MAVVIENQYLPDRAYVYQMDDETFQGLVTEIFDRNSREGIQTRFWLHLVEHHHYLSKSYLIDFAPRTLFVFIEQYAFRGIEDFIDSIRIIFGQLSSPPMSSYSEFFTLWTSKFFKLIMHTFERSTSLHILAFRVRMKVSLEVFTVFHS